MVESNFNNVQDLSHQRVSADDQHPLLQDEALARGVGEEAMSHIPPAMVNAVFHVTGKRVRHLPLKNHDLSWGYSYATRDSTPPSLVASGFSRKIILLVVALAFTADAALRAAEPVPLIEAAKTVDKDSLRALLKQGSTSMPPRGTAPRRCTGRAIATMLKVPTC